MRRVWAVARETLMETTRSRLVGVFVVALAAALLLLPTVASGGTLPDQVQTYLSWGVTMAGLLLSALTILLSCSVLCGEVQKRYVFTPLTKPVARWQFLLGRWVGLVLLMAILVGGVTGGMYGMVWYMSQRPADQAQRARLADQVLIARVQQAPLAPNVDQIVEQMRRELQQNESRMRELRGRFGNDAQADEAIEQKLREDAELVVHTTGPDGMLTWEFADLRRPASPETQMQLSVRVKPSGPLPDDTLHAIWIVGNPETGENLPMTRSDLASARITLPVPAGLISDSGRLFVGFRNARYLGDGLAEPNPVSVTILADDVRLLYPVGRFWPNLVRGMLLLLGFQVFLVALGVLASSFLSFPVSVLACSVLFTAGLAATFLSDAATRVPQPDVVLLAGYYLSSALLFIVPNFSAANPSTSLVDGLLISWTTVATVLVRLVIVQAGLSMLIGSLIYTRREMARVIV